MGKSGRVVGPCVVFSWLLASCLMGACSCAVGVGEEVVAYSSFLGWQAERIIRRHKRDFFIVLSFGLQITDLSFVSSITY